MRLGSLLACLNLIVLGLGQGELLCRHCGAEIASTDEENIVDLTGNSGAQTTHIRERKLDLELLKLVSPNKVVFEVLSVKKAHAKASSTRVSQEATFFENYNWRIASCPHCGNQIGWLHELNHNAPCRDKMKPSAEIESLYSHHDKELKGAAKLYTEEWALTGLKGRCIEKQWNGFLIENCFGFDVSMTELSRASKRTILGSYPKQYSVDDVKGKEPFHILGGKKRNYFPIVLERGDPCEFDTGFQMIEVQLLCCDSFTFSEEHLPLLERKHLRIEIFKRKSACEFVMMVCSPRFCLVEPYAVLRVEGKAGTQPKPKPSLSGRRDTKTKAVTNFCPVESFWGLMWDRLLHTESEDAMWMQAIPTVLQ